MVSELHDLQKLFGCRTSKTGRLWLPYLNLSSWRFGFSRRRPNVKTEEFGCLEMRETWFEASDCLQIHAGVFFFLSGTSNIKTETSEETFEQIVVVTKTDSGPELLPPDVCEKKDSFGTKVLQSSDSVKINLDMFYGEPMGDCRRTFD